MLLACAALSGCQAAPEPDAGALADAADSGSEGAGLDDGGSTDGGERQPYADVVAVSTSGADGALTFSVSVESSDTGCEQYADWWEVLDEGGALLYRRTLAHSHTDDNGTTDSDAPGNTFTRSGGPVDVTEDAVLTVRAHLHPVGYVGRAMRGSVQAGFEAYSPPAGFAAELRQAAPLPPACAF